MKQSELTVILNHSPLLNLNEFSHAIRVNKTFIVEMVEYQFIQPQGKSPEEWLFDSTSLRRGRIAASFYHDLEINMPGVALALELLERIENLEKELKVK